MTNNTSYQITADDLQECWNFSIDYFLNSKKDIVDRTNFMQRGLGGIVDSFMKKIHEIAVCEIIQNHNKKNFPKTDFELHDVGKTQGDNRTEPDIIRVFRSNFLESDFNSLEKSILSQKFIHDSMKSSISSLRALKSQLPLIKNCTTISQKDIVRKALKHWKGGLKGINDAIANINAQQNILETKFSTFEKQIQPKIYVEIKNTGLGDAWIGPKLKEVNSIMTRKNIPKSSIYYVYCRIVDSGSWENDSAKKAGRHSDPLGVFLKNFNTVPKTEKFHDVSDLKVEIQNVMSVADIELHGTLFPSGTIIPNPEIITFPGEGCTPYSQKKIQIRIDDGDFPEIVLIDNKLPKETSVKTRKQLPDNSWVYDEWATYPEALGDFTFTGQIKAYSEELGTLRRLWIKCLSPVVIHNEIIGDRKLKKGQIVSYQINRKGRIDKKTVDDIWICVQNDAIMKKFPASRISEIAKKI
jgi:hypothetical protein